MLRNHLLYFITLVETKSYTEAADRLFVSQSTISKAVRKLEEELGTTLIEGRGGLFQLTPSGHYLYAFAKDVLQYYGDREEELRRQIADTDSELRIGLPPTAGTIYFTGLIGSFREQYPSYTLYINNTTSRHMADLVLSGEIQIGVVIEPFEDHRFQKKIAYVSEASLLVSQKHPLAREQAVDFSHLAGEKFLMISKDYMYYQVFLSYCRLAGFVPNIIFENYNWDMIMDMVANGMGVSILPKPLLEKYASHRTRCIHLENPTFPWALSVIYDKRKVATQAMQKFLSLIPKAFPASFGREHE